MNKYCPSCKKILDIDLFYSSPTRSDGHRAYCKECSKKKNKETLDKYLTEHPEKYRMYAQTRIDKLKQQGRYKEFLRMNNSRCKLFYYVNKGIIIKPTHCSICGKESDRIEGHHFNYDKFTDVVWLCSSCHKKVHSDVYFGNRLKRIKAI